MKKLFTEDKASIHVYLSFLSLIIFIIVALAALFALFGLPLRLMPIIYIPPLLSFAGIVFGVLAIASCLKTNKYVIKLFAVIGILLNAALLLFFLAILTEIFPATMTAVVLDGGRKRDDNLGYGAVIIGEFCAIEKVDRDTPNLLVYVYENTKIYEQDGTLPRQKRRVGIEAIQPGQVVEIEYLASGDPEISDVFLFSALQITIRKGEDIPVTEFTENMRYQAANCSNYYLTP